MPGDTDAIETVPFAGSPFTDFEAVGETQKILSSGGLISAFDDVLTFGRRAVSEVNAAIDTLTELRFNTILTRRDTFLRSFPLSADERNALRSRIPSSGNSAQPPSAGIQSKPATQPLLGPLLSRTRERAILRPPLPLPRNPAHQPGQHQTQARRRPPPGAPGKKPPRAF
ncbi:hypothetical protein ACOMHN_022147 [Nucella lapillus]